MAPAHRDAGRERGRRPPCRLLLACVLGARSPVDTVPYWIGAHSIPRVRELPGDEVARSPVPEIEALRGAVHRQRDLTIVPGAQGHLAHVAGDALELQLTVDLRPTRAHRFRAAVRLSGDGRGARAWYEPAGNRIGVDRLRSPEQVYAPPGAATQREHGEKLDSLDIKIPGESVDNYAQFHVNLTNGIS